MSEQNDTIFSRVIEEHLELKRRNSQLDGNMPIDRYHVEDPFENHPLFKTEEQARLEDTLSGQEPELEPSKVLAWPVRGHRSAGRPGGHPLGPLARLRLGRLSS